MHNSTFHYLHTPSNACTTNQVGSLHQSQKREFRDWVMTVHAEFKTSSQLPAPVPR